MYHCVPHVERTAIQHKEAHPVRVIKLVLFLNRDDVEHSCKKLRICWGERVKSSILHLKREIKALINYCEITGMGQLLSFPPLACILAIVVVRFLSAATNGKLNSTIGNCGWEAAWAPAMRRPGACPVLCSALGSFLCIVFILSLASPLVLIWLPAITKEACFLGHVQKKIALLQYVRQFSYYPISILPCDSWFYVSTWLG